MYILTAREGEKRGGCVVNTLSQVTSDPQRLSVAVNKDNYTCGMIQRSGRFSATVLTQEAPMELIRAFGFQSSKDVDKFLGFEAAQDGAGVDYVAQYLSLIHISGSWEPSRCRLGCSPGRTPWRPAYRR